MKTTAALRRQKRPAKRHSQSTDIFAKRRDIQEWWKGVVDNPNFQKVLDAAHIRRRYKKDLYDQEHQQVKADNYNDGFADHARVLEELASYKPSKKQTRRDNDWEHTVDPDLTDALEDEDIDID